MSDRIYTEQQEKQRAYEAQNGAALGNEAEPKRESLSQRFKSQAARLRWDSKKADQIDELNYLLEKNPELARILDLVDALGNGY